MNSRNVNNLPVIEACNLHLKIAENHILNNLNFTIRPGTFVGLIGPNGAGKSSLLRCLYRYKAPSSGCIQFFGKKICEYSRQEYAKFVAVVLQEIPEHFNLTVFDVVAMGVLPHKKLFSSMNLQDKTQIMHAINKVGLDDKVIQSFSHLSGGEKQRALIARAIVQQPTFLIMDEPTSHLDVKYQIQIMELAKSLNITVLASFHDLNLAAALCDEIIVMQHGAIAAQGAPIDVLTAQLLSNVFGVRAEVNSVLCPFDGITRTPFIRYLYGCQL
jgi:iron complex transport system ATP-binding protein